MKIVGSLMNEYWGLGFSDEVKIKVIINGKDGTMSMERMALGGGGIASSLGRAFSGLCGDK